MRLVVATDKNTVAINYTWLPTWMGMDPVLVGDLNNHLKGYTDAPLTDAVLDDMHDDVVIYLQNKFRHMRGLGHLFEALQQVEYQLPLPKGRGL
jgi:hypothetical protein